MSMLLTALKENPIEAITVGAAILVGAVLAILTIIGAFHANLAIGVSLEALAIMIAMLFYLRAKTNQVEQTTRKLLAVEGKLDQGAQETQNGFHEIHNQLQNMKDYMEETRLHPFRLSEVFDTFGEKVPELESDLKKSDQVWILSRTCRRLWGDFRDELIPLAQKGELRVLLLDPDGHALGLAVNPATWDRPEDRDLARQNVRHFLDSLQGLCQQHELDNLEVRKIDYLPAWTLILVNPGDENGVSDNGKAYVEMSTYIAHPRKRPCFTISSDKDHDLFSEFREEFCKMWDEAPGAW